MKYRRIRMFWYEHGTAILSFLGVVIAAGFVYLLASADCATDGPCLFANNGLADAILPPRR